jgi:hypothetical protein
MLIIVMFVKGCRYTLTACLITFVSYFCDLYLYVHMFIRIIIQYKDAHDNGNPTVSNYL